MTPPEQLILETVGNSPSGSMRSCCAPVHIPRTPIADATPPTWTPSDTHSSTSPPSTVEHCKTHSQKTDISNEVGNRKNAFELTSVQRTLPSAMTETVPRILRGCPCRDAPVVSPATWIVGRWAYSGISDWEYDSIRRRIEIIRTASCRWGSSNSPESYDTSEMSAPLTVIQRCVRGKGLRCVL